MTTCEMNTHLASAGSVAAEPGFVMRNEKALTALVLATNLVLWASAFVFIPVALEGYSPLQLASSRQMLAALAVLPALFLLRRGEAWQSLKEDWRMLLLAGGGGVAVYHVLLGTGQQTVSVGTASLLVSLSPVLTAILAAHFLGERMSRRALVGTAIAFVGAAGLAVAGNGEPHFEPAALLILFAALAQAIYFIAQRQMAKRRSATAIAVGTICVSCAVLLPFSGGLGEAVRTAPMDATRSILYLGIAAGVLPFFGWAWILKRMSAASASLWLFAIPPLSTLMAWVILGEVPGTGLLAFGTLALIGVGIAQTRSKYQPYERSKSWTDKK